MLGERDHSCVSCDVSHIASRARDLHIYRQASLGGTPIPRHPAAQPRSLTEATDSTRPQEREPLGVLFCGGNVDQGDCCGLWCRGHSCACARSRKAAAVIISIHGLCPILASGPVNRTQRPNHGCTDQACDVKCLLANTEPPFSDWRGPDDVM